MVGMASSSSTSHNDGQICPDHFGFECVANNCCASYHQRFLMLLFSLGILAIAVVILIVWLAIEFRPSKRLGTPIPTHRDKRALSEVEIKSNEETKYLRRMSELNPTEKFNPTSGEQPEPSAADFAHSSAKYCI
uniref:Uncharacterized protein n=1 Tax=Ditylenchus dipsaci TaxID=166011 RepID=A0A915D0Y7_9BILA